MPKRTAPVQRVTQEWNKKLERSVNLFYSICLYSVETHMNKATIIFSSILFSLSLLPQAAAASDLMVPTATQRCETNADCTLVTNSCSDNCAFAPINKQNVPTLNAAYEQRCGKTVEANIPCTMNPPMSAACINSRCTIDAAYKEGASAQDYQSGAFPVPEQAVPSKVPATVAPTDDRQGYTAYQIPNQEAVREGSLGQIKIYVPSDAPVSGGNYVPVASAIPTPVAAPAKAAPAPAPKAVEPQQKVPAPTPAPQAPTPAPVAEKPAVPTPSPVTVPQEIVDAPPMPTPLTPAEATNAATQPVPAPTVKPVPAPAPVPTATTTPSTAATSANPIPSSANPALPEPRVPDSQELLRGVSPDTGNPNAPIPPSEFKSQTFVPPPGSTIEVAPEDPGAKPPAGTTLLGPIPRGPEDEEPLTIIQPAP
jgi:hypothetical protein